MTEQEIKDYLYSGKNRELDYQNELAGNIVAILEILIRKGLTTEKEFEQLKENIIKIIQDKQVKHMTDEEKAQVQTIRKFNDLFEN